MLASAKVRRQTKFVVNSRSRHATITEDVARNGPFPQGNSCIIRLDDRDSEGQFSDATSAITVCSLRKVKVDILAFREN